MRQAGRPIIPVCAALCLHAVLIVTIGCSNLSPGTGQEASAGANPTVAEVEGNPIKLEELDEWLKDEWLREKGSDPSALFELRQAGLQRMIDVRLVEAEAERRGVDGEVILTEIIASAEPVSDEEIATFYEEHKDRIQGDHNLEKVTPEIRAYLEQERPALAMAEFRSRADVEIFLSSPRFELAGHGVFKGREDAPVTLTEFSDYECPYCKRAEPTVDAILARYPERVRLEYRHLPLPFHPHARGAAEAAVCAEAQGRFWEYHALVFQSQGQLSAEVLAGYADDLGLDREAFEACLTSTSTRQRIEQDIAVAQAAGATGTPTFFINGIMLPGARPEADFVEVIEAELARLDATR
jgi:protein-disulfide isomerase